MPLRLEPSLYASPSSLPSESICRIALSIYLNKRSHSPSANSRSHRALLIGWKYLFSISGELQRRLSKVTSSQFFSPKGGSIRSHSATNALPRFSTRFTEVRISSARNPRRSAPSFARTFLSSNVKLSGYTQSVAHARSVKECSPNTLMLWRACPTIECSSQFHDCLLTNLPTRSRCWGNDRSSE